MLTEKVLKVISIQPIDKVLLKVITSARFVSDGSAGAITP